MLDTCSLCDTFVLQTKHFFVEVNMIIRNCLELLTELAELEKLVSEKKDLLEELGLEIDCDDLLLKHISLKRAS